MSLIRYVYNTVMKFTEYFTSDMRINGQRMEIIPVQVFIQDCGTYNH
jgi:hypothetical protein